MGVVGRPGLEPGTYGLRVHSCGKITGFDLEKGMPDDDAWWHYMPFGPRPLLYPHSTTLLRCRVLPGYTAAYEQTSLVRLPVLI
jgi:hypothetical protein